MVVQERRRVVKVFKKPSLTKQCFKDRCDMTKILNGYQKTGLLSHVNRRANAPQYIDVTNVRDYQTALNMVINAQSMFQRLPSSVRDMFGNDPQFMLTWLADEENRPEAEKLGLLPTSAAPAPQGVSPSSNAEEEGGGARTSTKAKKSSPALTSKDSEGGEDGSEG
jgi:phage internal scaffolding protein